jgi:hypothetical protein
MRVDDCCSPVPHPLRVRVSRLATALACMSDMLKAELASTPPLNSRNPCCDLTRVRSNADVNTPFTRCPDHILKILKNL